MDIKGVKRTHLGDYSGKGESNLHRMSLQVSRESGTTGLHLVRGPAPLQIRTAMHAYTQPDPFCAICASILTCKCRQLTLDMRLGG